MNNTRIIYLDLLRGISALIVCAGHLRNVLFVDFPQSQIQGIFAKSFYFVTGLGHEAVMVFFVLSGYFVGGSVLRRLSSFSMKNYLVARITRLHTVAIPALIFTLLIDILIQGVDSSILSGEMYGVFQSGPNSDFSASIITFIGNLFFLQTLEVPVFGSNAPLWSLAYEFWFYILFPLLLIISKRISTSLQEYWLYCVTFLIICYFFLNVIGVGFGIWILGTIVFYLHESNSVSKKDSRLKFWITLLLFIASLLVSSVHYFGQVVTDLLIGLTLSIHLLYAGKNMVAAEVDSVIDKAKLWLSDISYSLYAFHFPIVLLMYALFPKQTQLNLSFRSINLYILLLVLLLFVGWLSYILFEANTHSVKRRVRKLIS